jgi:hypothetical protein
VGRSRSDPRPSCGSCPGRPQRAGGKEVAEWRTSEGGEERTGAKQSTPGGGMEDVEGGDRAEECTLEGGRPLAGSADGRTRGGRREKERKIEMVRV